MKSTLSFNLISLLLQVIISKSDKEGILFPVRWTPWYNTDQPDGVGDMERLSTLIQLHRKDMCEQPVHIEVRTRDGLHVKDADQVVHYSPAEGFWCLNEEQQFTTCLDYKVRFLCPVNSEEESVKIIPDKNKEKYGNSTAVDTFDNIVDEWMDWSSWSPCDVTCGGVGSQERIKRCQDGIRKCQGREVAESRPCGSIPCQSQLKKCSTSGLVTDTTDIPLQGVEIALGSASGSSYTTLTFSNETGSFHVEGICADSTYAHLVAIKDSYVTTRAHLKVNDSGNAFAKVRMIKSVFPTIYQHPEDKTRILGQNVKFCCKARGSIKEQVYSWYHNGTLVDVALYSRDPRSLEISKVKAGHAGTYWCQVQSLATTKKVVAVSEIARLSVFSTESSACVETPLANYIKLPNDCITDETIVKRNKNRTYVDVGACSSEICPKRVLTSSGCEETSSIQCCSPVERDEIIISCGEYNIPVQRVVRCGCQKCVKPVTKIQGRVFGNDPSEPLRYGFVYLSGQKVSVTSYDGRFSLDVPRGTRRLVLTFEDRFGKLMTTTKVLPFKAKGGVTFHEVKMAPKAPEIILNSRDRSMVPLNGMNGQESIAQVVMSPDSFYKKDGKKYTGKVRASVTFIDPRNETSYELAPSDLTYVDANGETVPLTTYGMFELDFRDGDSNQLNVGKAKILLDGNQISSSSLSKNLKLWSLNPENGMWEMEDDFQVTTVEYEDRANSSAPKRRKREDQTFLVGNLEIRQRRLYNLDAPAEYRCWMKVRAYRSPEFDSEEQVEGVEVTVINMEPEAGFRGNPQAWGRFDAALTSKNGACVRAFCHAERVDAYKAIVAAKLNANEELYAAPSGFPANPDVVGVEAEILKTLKYQRSDHNEASGKKTSFRTNLPKPEPGTKLTGPIYPEANFQDCQRASATDNHFRFYRTEDFLYEYNTIYMDEHDCLTWTPNYLNWWPNPTEYRACYIKVHINSPKGSVVRVKSEGGTHPETAGKLYGIRDDRSVSHVTEDDENVHETTACVEFKCSGMLYDMDVPDRTLVTVIPQGDCHLHRINPKLFDYLTSHPPAVEAESRSEFRMYAPTDPLGHNYGIYTVTDDDPLNSKRTALGRCYAGSSDVTSKIMMPRKGVALFYRCSNGQRDTELP